MGAAVCVGGALSLSAAATNGPLSYQWQRDGVDLLDGLDASGCLVSGATTGTLTLSNIQPGDRGSYACVASNPCGSAPTAPAAVVVNSADFNGDGDIGTDADIEAFFACLSGVCCATCGTADFNADGDVGTDLDIESFFRVLAGGAC